MLTVNDVLLSDDLEKVRLELETSEIENILREDWLLHEDRLKGVENFKKMNKEEKIAFAQKEGKVFADSQLKLHPFEFITSYGEQFGEDIIEESFHKYLESLSFENICRNLSELDRDDFKSIIRSLKKFEDISDDDLYSRASRERDFAILSKKIEEDRANYNF